MKKCIVMAALIASIATATVAFANGSVGDTQVVEVNVTGNIATVDVEDESVGAPVCATNNKRWVFAINTDEGKAYLKLVVSAKLSSTPISIWGKGTCTGSGENINQLRFGM